MNQLADIIIIRDNNVSVYLDDGITVSHEFYEDGSKVLSPLRERVLFGGKLMSVLATK